MGKFAALLIAAAAASGLAACSTINDVVQGPERVKVEDSDFFRSDASQRYILTKNRRIGPGNGPITEQITCAEPSPDVAVATSRAIAASLAAKGSTPGGASGEVDAGMSSSVAQSVAELGRRAATTQLLRDALYRACEAYSNGAIDESMYAVLLSRIDDLTVTLLTAEFMSGSQAGQAAAVAPQALAGKGEARGADGGGSATVTHPSAAAVGGSDFVQMQEQYLADDKAGATTVAVACIAALNKKVSDPEKTVLHEKCSVFWDKALPILLAQ